MRAVLVAAALMVLAGCGGASEPAADPPRETPSALGGEIGSPVRPPEGKMNVVERTVASELSRHLEHQNLSVDYLACPHFDGHTPKQLVCHGYVDGVVTDVRVKLVGPPRRMRFDAWLARDVLATENLVSRLRAEGYRQVDCGDRAAYPVVVRSRIVCSVIRHDRQKYVVATVTNGQGEVEIDDY